MWGNRHFDVKTLVLLMLMTTMVLMGGPLRGAGEEEGGRGEDLTAEELMAAGRAAFERGEFGEAEARFGQLVEDYGENETVAGMIEGIRPMQAMCRIKAGAFEEALGLVDGALAQEKLAAEAREELSFWRGICLLRTGETAVAQEQFGVYFAKPEHDRTRRYEAFLLFASGYLQLEDPAGAAEFLEEQIPKLPADQGEVGGRATVLLLHSLMEAGRMGAAVGLVRRSFPRLEGMTQVLSFQLLTLQLGAERLEAGKAYEAITCLNRLWGRERLLGHQRKKLEEWRGRRELLRAEGARRETLVFQVDGVIARIERELGEFEKVASYDASLRLRQAQAFMELERWREAGMILDAAVEGLETDGVVEQAALTALDCWGRCGDDGRLLVAADRYLEVFGEHGRGDHVPEALFARGEALRGMERMEEAERAFGDVANDWPEHGLAARAMLMGGICQLESGREDAGLQTFEALRKRFRRGPLHEDAAFWEAMALSFLRRYEEAEKALDGYLKAYPDGRYAADALFEKGRTLHNRLRHAEAAPVLAAFLKRHGEHRQAGDARLLHGESLLALGELEPGLKELRAVPAEDVRLHEAAVFKEGEVLGKLERWGAVREHFAKFVREHPRSARLAEAVHEQARAAAKSGQLEKARELARAVVLESGDDVRAEGVEDVLLGMARLYRGVEETRALHGWMEKEAAGARKAGKKTLALRLEWARGHLVRGEERTLARSLWFGLRELLDPAVHDPRMALDCAEAWREMKGYPVARGLYEVVRKWHPRSAEKERAALGLGLIAQVEGKEDEALEWFERCVAESVSGVAAAEAQLEKAVIERGRKRYGAAMETLAKVTGSRLASSRQKARALLELGRCAQESGDAVRAAGYFERCYLSGGKWKESAAEARWQHGRVLEEMNEAERARAVYRELVERRDLAGEPVVQAAKERLKAMGGEA